jgi:hypothetical protein
VITALGPAAVFASTISVAHVSKLVFDAVHMTARIGASERCHAPFSLDLATPPTIPSSTHSTEIPSDGVGTPSSDSIAFGAAGCSFQVALCSVKLRPKGGQGVISGGVAAFAITQ